jgi:hypothetical protein
MDNEMVEAREKLAVATGAALLLAGLILVIVVLPAEYGFDPLGTGARLGLVGLGQVEQAAEASAAASGAAAGGAMPAVAPKEAAYNQETVEFTLGPREWVEYKYRLGKGDALLYSWRATGNVDYELHGEPDGAPRGYADTYDKQAAKSQASGALTAPSAGIHGWYWENRATKPVTVSLTTAGFYRMSYEFHDGAETKTKIFN